jgi:hypothetical protein
MYVAGTSHSFIVHASIAYIAYVWRGDSVKRLPPFPNPQPHRPNTPSCLCARAHANILTPIASHVRTPPNSQLQRLSREKKEAVEAKRREERVLRCVACCVAHPCPVLTCVMRACGHALSSSLPLMCQYGVDGLARFFRVGERNGIAPPGIAVELVSLTRGADTHTHILNTHTPTPRHTHTATVTSGRASACRRWRCSAGRPKLTTWRSRRKR